MGPQKPEVKKKLSRKEQKLLDQENKRKAEQERKIQEEKMEEQRKRKQLLQKQQQERLAGLQRDLLEAQEDLLKAWKVELDGKKQKAEQNLKLEVQWEQIQVCEQKPDSDLESEITTFITQYKESEGVFERDVPDTLKQMQYSEKVVEDIMDRMLQAKTEGRTEDLKRLDSFIKCIRDVTENQVFEINAWMSMNAEIMHEKRTEQVNNKTTQEKNTGFKTDDKHKYEIYKTYPPLEDFRYGLWLNYDPKRGNSGYRHKPIEFTESNIYCDLPRTFMNIPTMMKCYWTSFDHFSDPTKYFPFLVTGGVLNIQCLKPPPPSKPIQNSFATLRSSCAIKDAVEPMPYPDNNANMQNVVAFKVQYSIPPYLFMMVGQETPYKVAYFDLSLNVWNHTECIEEVKYEPEKRMLTFNTTKLAPYAYIQDRCTEYPYKEWSLRCVKSNKAIVDIKGRRQDFRFEIGPSYAKLLDRKEPELSSISDKPMNVGTLLNRLAKSGINLMPVKQDAETAHICEQDEKAEKRAIEDVSFAVRSYFVQSSRFSNELPAEKILLRIKENLEYDQKFAEDQEKDWRSTCWWPNKVAIIQSRDSQMSCNQEFFGENVAHINLEIVLKNHVDSNNPVPQEAIDRMHETENLIFSDTVARFLMLTQLLSFTAEKVVV